MNRAQIYKTTLCLCLLILFSGCVEKAKEKTRKGKNIYDSWSFVMENVITNYIDIPFLFNTWFETPEEMRSDIQEALLPEYEIRAFNENEWCLFKNGKLIYCITKDEHSLSEPGAEWKVTIHGPYIDRYQEYYTNTSCISFQYDTVTLEIFCSKTNEWNIMMSENQSLNSEINFVIKSSEDDFNLGLSKTLFTLQGKGTLTFTIYNYYDYRNEIAYLSFETIRELTFSHIGYYFREYSHSYSYQVPYWSSGDLKITTFNNVDEPVDIRAAFIRAGSRFYTDITYCGITEEWELSK